MTENYQSQALKDLENKLDLLIIKYDKAKNENSYLKMEQERLASEKMELLEKAALAKTRLETVIARLKVLENASWVINPKQYPLP